MKYQLCSICFVIVLSSTSSLADTVDSHVLPFSAGELIANAGAPLDQDTSFAGIADIIGGQRDAALEFFSGPVGSSITADIGASGLEVESVDDGVGQFRVQFDANGVGLGADFTGDNAVVHDFLDVTGEVQVDFQVFDFDENRAERSVNVVGASPVRLVSLFQSDFSYFDAFDSPITSSGFNGANISRITAAFSPSAGSSFSLGVVESAAVPEPSTFALAVGLLSLGMMRRKKGVRGGQVHLTRMSG